MEEEENLEQTPRERSLANLKPAQPGEIRNPNGRPKGPNAKTVILAFLNAKDKEKIRHPITGKMVRLTQLQMITLAQIAEARNGNTQAFNALLDRTEGKPEQKNINAFEEGTEINLTIGKPKPPNA